MRAKGGPAKTLTLGAGLGAKAPQPPALGRSCGAPPATYKRRGKGRGAAPHWEPLWQTLAAPPMLLHLHLLRHPSQRAAASCISSTKAAASTLDVGLLLHLLLSLSSCLAWRSPARGDLHHQRRHNRRGAEIYLATSSSLAGSRRRSLHQAVRADTAEVLLLRRFIGLYRVDNTSPRD